MKTILTALILLAALHLFAEETPQTAGPATNSVITAGAGGSMTNKKASAKADAYTGATRKDKKQK